MFPFLSVKYNSRNFTFILHIKEERNVYMLGIYDKASPTSSIWFRLRTHNNFQKL